MTEKFEKVQVMLEPEMAKKLKELAVKDVRSLSGEIRFILKGYLKV